MFFPVNPKGRTMESVAVFHHHIYEYQKGLRNLVLFTCDKKEIEYVSFKLTKCSIDYVVYHVGVDRANVFFGDETCLEVIRRIGKADLVSYTDEEDFILGIMLGYCRSIQCRRYLKRKGVAMAVRKKTSRGDVM